MSLTPCYRLMSSTLRTVDTNAKVKRNRVCLIDGDANAFLIGILFFIAFKRVCLSENFTYTLRILR